MIAVLIVAFVTAGNDYSKQLQFLKLRKDQENQAQIQVRRLENGKSVIKALNPKELLVGDICLLTTGNEVPADCVLIDGRNVSTDESALTGESREQVKTPTKDPFLLSGSTLKTGDCSCVVIAVGMNSQVGEIKKKFTMEDGNTPLQDKLNSMVKIIGYVGTASAAATLLALVILWFAKFKDETEDTGDGVPPVADYMIESFIIAVTIIVVAIPEGLPLAVTISLAYSTRKMFRENNLIRHLAACETMGNATDICSDKTGTLTLNQMTVTEGW